MSGTDIVSVYASSQGLTIARKTLLVEGTSDVELFRLCARLHAIGGLFSEGAQFSICAAGQGDRGGATGVVRELIALRQMARGVLDRNGAPIYRFAALFDNDEAGNKAIRTACGIDSSIIENRDIFKLHPIMPILQTTEPGAIGRALLKENSAHKALKWELEDLVDSDFVSSFIDENPSSLIRRDDIASKTHWELTFDGKSRLLRYLKDYANAADVKGVADALNAIRSYMGERPVHR